MTDNSSIQFTEYAQEVALFASSIRRRYGHSQIDTEHILLALIEHPNGIASDILSNLGVDIGSLAERLDKFLLTIPRENKNKFDKAETIYITPKVKHVIDKSFEETVRLHDEQISNEHILLAILHEKTTPAFKLLEALNITSEAVNAEILKIRQANEIKKESAVKSNKQLPHNPQSLRVFLCHSSGDKPKVRELYQRLRNDGLEPWLDEEELLPGFDWQLEIPKAVQNSDVVIVCLSKDSITKAGYVQKEIRQALDVADEQPEGIIFIIPVKLEECEVPKRLSRWQWVNLYSDNGYQRLLRSLGIRAEEKKKVKRA
jgi:hypothetical protein